jgi:hypothetical protein
VPFLSCCRSRRKHLSLKVLKFLYIPEIIDFGWVSASHFFLHSSVSSLVLAFFFSSLFFQSVIISSSEQLEYRTQNKRNNRNSLRKPFFSDLLSFISSLNFWPLRKILYLLLRLTYVVCKRLLQFLMVRMISRNFSTWFYGTR